LSSTNTAALIVSIFTILFLIGFAALKRRRPDNRFLAKFPPILFAVVVGTLVSSAFDLASYGVVVLGTVNPNLRVIVSTRPNVLQSPCIFSSDFLGQVLALFLP
jgi:MFS superfamily sulfate permease-like transporter